MQKSTLLLWVILLSLVSAQFGCESNAGNGALIGGAGGAAVGGAIGSLSHARAGEGALIGAAVGALGGALVGHEMDKAKQREEQEDRVSDPRYDQPRADVVTKADVIAWTRQGVSDDVIIDRIQRSNSTFRLTAADENELRDRHVSELVIRAMRGTSNR